MRKGGSNVPRKVHLRRQVVQQSHLAALLTLQLHVGALHGNQFVARGLNHSHPFDTCGNGSLLALVARDDLAVLVDEHRPSGTHLLERTRAAS